MLVRLWGHPPKFAESIVCGHEPDKWSTSKRLIRSADLPEEFQGYIGFLAG
jgi:hypothetical protein